MIQQNISINSQLEEIISTIPTQKEVVKIATISTTANIQNSELHISFPKMSNDLWVSSYIFRDSQYLEQVINRLDGLVDFFAIDIEKHKGYSSLLDDAQKLVKKSNLIYFSPNKLTIDALEIFLTTSLRQNTQHNVAILGAGNIGLGMARRLMALPFFNVEIVTRNPSAILRTHLDLNDTKVKLCTYTDFLSRENKFTIILGCTAGFPTFTAEMVKRVEVNGIVVDVGNGCFTGDAISKLQELGVYAYSFNVAPYMLNYFKTYIDYKRQQLNKPYKEAGGYSFIKFGFLGKKGDVLVDCIDSPTRIFGICDGNGGITEQSNAPSLLAGIKKIKGLKC